MNLFFRVLLIPAVLFVSTSLIAAKQTIPMPPPEHKLAGDKVVADLKKIGVEKKVVVTAEISTPLGYKPKFEERELEIDIQNVLGLRLSFEKDAKSEVKEGHYKAKVNVTFKDKGYTHISIAYPDKKAKRVIKINIDTDN